MIVDLCKKYKGVLLYLVFGVLTTLVNWVCYVVFTDVFHVSYLWSTVLSQLLAILFAYVTNRRWVFESKVTGFRNVVIEMAKFFGCRGVSFFLDIGLMYVGVDLLCFNDKIMKLVSNFVIVLVNYLASKLFVFRKSK